LFVVGCRFFGAEKGEKEMIAEMFSSYKFKRNPLRLTKFATLRDNKKSESPKDGETIKKLLVVGFLAQRREKRR